MNETGLRVRRGSDVDALASALIERLNAIGGDPFAQPLIFVPGAGLRRWLSQRIATAAPEGICAGLRFEDLSRLDEVITGHDADDDPWTPERLVWRILELVDAGIPGLEPLAHHLAASEQRYANAARVAHLLGRYARLRPAMLQRWSSALDVDELGLGFDGWQAVLWRALHQVITAPDPVVRRAQVLTALAAGDRAVDAPGVTVFCPRRITAPDADLLGALAQRRLVDVFVQTPGPQDSQSPLAARLARAGAETAHLLEDRASEVIEVPAARRPTTWLGALQSDLEAGVAPQAREIAPSDQTIDVHASHGLSRQAEVLREVLTGIFADDPTLEPRHVVVATPDPAALAPHLVAAFRGDPGGVQHPAFTFRLQVADASAAETNALYGLVTEVAQLGATRATAGQLVGLATHPFVARRFGFTADDVDRLSELVAAASVRWGVNDAHRRTFGLERVRQGTWQVGVQRLLLGEALSDDTLASAGVIAPVDDVESSDVALLGGLAELVSRLTRLVRRPERATAGAWVEHLREIVDTLTDVSFDDSWQLAQMWSVLEVIERRSADSPALLSSADALALLAREFEGRTARPAYGNGSLVVASLGALTQVPHRVVCLVGLDERSFPRRGIADGDDLLARDPQPGDPNPGRDDRQTLIDALGAARERLVIIYQGWSSHTLESRPAPSGVIDVIEAAATTAGGVDVVRHEPLQPFSPDYFGPSPRSFDQTALAAAQALVGPRAPAPDRYALPALAPQPPASLELSAIVEFLTHPAKYFLAQAAGLSLFETERPTDELPIETDGLARWKVGDRLLTALLRGHEVGAAQKAAWLSGELPPGEIGRRLLDDVTAKAVRVAEDARPLLAAPLGVHLVDLSLDGLRVTGRGTLHGDVHVACTFSSISAKHLAAAWVEVLALSCVLQRPVEARLHGGGKRQRLLAPDPDAAASLLTTLAGLAVEGATTVLPAPPRVAQRWAEIRARNADPLASGHVKSLNRVWSYDRDAAWDAVLHGKPWAPKASGTPWAQQGEDTLLGSLAEVAWRPIVRGTRA